MNILDIAKLVVSLSPFANRDITINSLTVTINSEGVKLDIESLITNERVTQQMTSVNKIMEINNIEE